MTSFAEDPTNTSADRVRRSTAVHLNKHIDRKTDLNVKRYAHTNQDVIKHRILELDEEWDVERVLEVNASTIALTGLLLALTGNKKWLLVPITVMSFLFQHGVKGWCPPLPILRRLGVRTRGEIDREKYQLKALLNEH